MKHFLTTALAASLCAGLCAERMATSLEITGFVEESALQAAGAQVGDLILAYDGKSCFTLTDLEDYKEQAIGDVELILQRGREKLTVVIPAGQLGVRLRTLEPDHAVDGDAVRIEGIGRLGWDLGMECTFHACVFRLDEKFGRGLSYADILGLSGYAFRFHVFSESLCPSAPDATCGFDTGKHVLDLLGYDSAPHFLDTVKTDEAPADNTVPQAELEEIIYSGLDAGWPSIAIDLIETPEWGIVTGYQKGGEEMFCRTFFDQTRDYELANKFPWVVFPIRGYAQKDIANAYRASLQTARELLETESFGDYHSGLAGYDRWIAHIEAIDGVTDVEQLSEAMHANWWMYVSLSSARYFAVQYLQANADKFGLPPEEIGKLAAIYQRQHELLNANYASTPGVMSGGAPEDWTHEQRSAQIETIRELKQLEAEALEILRKA